MYCKGSKFSSFLNDLSLYLSIYLSLSLSLFVSFSITIIQQRDNNKKPNWKFCGRRATARNPRFGNQLLHKPCNWAEPPRNASEFQIRAILRAKNLQIGSRPLLVSTMGSSLQSYSNPTKAWVPVKIVSNIPKYILVIMSCFDLASNDVLLVLFATNIIEQQKLAGNRLAKQLEKNFFGSESCWVIYPIPVAHFVL